tara:strand:+ start:1862 stop:2938 length:1077 start_codon:yes stop_codon:yes gene_type:complete
MSKKNLFFKTEIITKSIITNYSKLSKNEYKENNPVCSGEHLEWKYMNNPFGFSNGVNGYDEKKLVARVSYQKKKFFFKNKILMGVNLCDLLISKNYRTIENFLKLTDEFFVKKKLPASNFSLMIPNEKSLPLYKTILRITPIGNLEIRFFPVFTSLLNYFLGCKIFAPLNFLIEKLISIFLNFFKYFSKINFSVKKIEKVEYENMINKYYKDELLQGDRSFEWISWRYNKKSKINYSIEYIYFKNNLIGYFAYRKIKKFRINMILLMETVLIKKNFLIEISILLKLIKTIINSNCSFLINIRTRQKNNFLNNRFLFPFIPNYLLPNPLELFMINNSKIDKEALNIKNHKINMADLDIF